MNPRKELIRKLSQEENVGFLLELKDLLPDILIELRLNIFESTIDVSQEWNGYKNIRYNDVIFLTNENFNSPSYFQFAIYVGYEGKMLYGIIGPWNKKEAIEEIKIFYENCQRIGLVNWNDKYRNNWMYIYFSQDNETIYSLIRNGQNIENIIIPFFNEFNSNCFKVKSQLEELNNFLQKY